MLILVSKIGLPRKIAFSKPKVMYLNLPGNATLLLFFNLKLALKKATFFAINDQTLAQSRNFFYMSNKNQREKNEDSP